MDRFGTGSGQITVKITILMGLYKSLGTLILGLVQKLTGFVYSLRIDGQGRCFSGNDCVNNLIKIQWGVAAQTIALGVGGPTGTDAQTSSLSGLGMKLRKAWKLALYFLLSSL